MPEIRIRDGLPCKGVALPTTYVEPGRWYQVEADVAAYAATVRLHPTSTTSPLVFEVRDAAVQSEEPAHVEPEPEPIAEAQPPSEDAGEGGSGETNEAAAEAAEAVTAEGAAEPTAPAVEPAADAVVAPVPEAAAEPPARARRRRDAGDGGKEGGGRA